ncbi:MAG: substrate-binding domain-containing protein, partial [Candidatus Hodarchaeota archaeon]
LCSTNCNGTYPFYSRGDNSGTNVKELSIWNQTAHGIPDSGGADGSWYFETGSGMGTTLTIANENDGYTLTDRGTWLSMEDSLSFLETITENDSSGILLNPYSFILVNKTLYPHVNQDLAEKLVSFFLCEYGQQKIDSFLVNGNQLFTSCWGYQGSIVELQTDPADETFWNSTIASLGMDTLS